MYINQFFGGIGGEDKAGYEPSVEEGPVGPGNVILSCLKEAEITHTIICGDNFMTGHRDEAIERIDQFLKGIEFDLFLAGPAFQSGRYGMSCGEICKYITEKYHVTAVTSMNEENPGVAASAMAGLAAKVLSGEEILWAEAEGYFPHGVRVSVKSKKAPAERAVRMMLSKLQGQPFKTEFPIEQEDTVVPAAPVDAGRAKIAVITTGSLVPVGNPDRIPSGSASVWKRYDIRGLEAFKKNEFYSVHGGFSTNNVNEDPEVLVPLTALKEAEREGKIGKLDDYYYVTTGNLTILKEARKMGREIVEQLKMDGIQAAIMVAT